MAVMNPRTHPRGAPPSFELPRPNPNPGYQTNALWWLVCMRLALEPGSRNGGTYANKAGFHNIGNNLPSNDHSIRETINRTGPWWRERTAAHDWTFPDAQAGNFATIDKYTSRVINAMRDPDDPRPDLVYYYVIGQADRDRAVEGYKEYSEENITGDESHLWHRHDSFLRSAIGDFWAMWAALTIDMGWTVAEWRQSLPKDEPDPIPTISAEYTRNIIMSMVVAHWGMQHHQVKRLQALLNMWSSKWNLAEDGFYGPATAAAVKEWKLSVWTANDPNYRNDSYIRAADWSVLITGSKTAHLAPPAPAQ